MNVYIGGRFSEWALWRQPGVVTTKSSSVFKWVLSLNSHVTQTSNSTTVSKSFSCLLVIEEELFRKVLICDAGDSNQGQSHLSTESLHLA